MLKRDFTKSNKQYFKANLIPLICVGVFVLVGILLASILGMNGNFETKGAYEFSIKTGSETVVADYEAGIKSAVNSHNAKFDTVSVYDEGDDTRIVVRYSKELSGTEVAELNADLVNEFAEKGVELSDISAHNRIEPIVTGTHYLYTIAGILVMYALVALFSYFRYNGASALTAVISGLVGTAGFISLGAILRLECGVSYFAMLIVLNMLIMYNAINVFENIRRSSWLSNKDYANAIGSAMQASKFRTVVLSSAVFVVGLLFVAMTPNAVKYVSLNIMFMAVCLLAVSLYVVPFVWSVFITRSKVKAIKVKETNKAEEISENK